MITPRALVLLKRAMATWKHGRASLTKLEIDHIQTVYVVIRQLELTQTIWAICCSLSKAAEIANEAEADELMDGEFVIEDWRVI